MVCSWGASSFGRLGIHDLTSKKVVHATRVTTLDNFAVQTLAAGDFHMLALTRDRRVFSWGYGAEGQVTACPKSLSPHDTPSVPPVPYDCMPAVPWSTQFLQCALDFVAASL